MWIRDALRAYADYMKYNKNIVVTFTHEIEYSFVHLLQAQIDATAHYGQHQIPIIIKFIHHPKEKSILEIVSWRSPFCISQFGGEFSVSHGSALWYRCQSVIFLKKVSEMIVLCFNPKTSEIVPITVLFAPNYIAPLLIDMINELLGKEI